MERLSHGKMPNKLDISQNFLKSREYTLGLFRRTDISKGHTVVEIGPGKGAITEAIAEMSERVVGIELDKRLANLLKQKFSDDEKVEIVHGDFFKQNLRKYESLVVVGNPPFNHTRRLIDMLFLEGSYENLKAAYLILQEAAAEKFVGKPAATLVSALLAIEGWERNVLERIPRDKFEPRPKTDAALVEFKKVRGEGSVVAKDLIAHIFTYHQKNDTLEDNLGRVFTRKQAQKIVEDLNKKGMTIKDLSDEDWLHISRVFEKLANQKQLEKIKGKYNTWNKSQKRLPKTHRTRQY